MNEEIERALRTALKLESDGTRYYEMTAKHCTHKGVKEIFKKFAEDEKIHYKTILKYYEKYTDTGQWPEKKFDREFEHESHELDKVFTKEFFDSLKTSSSELSAISTGILLEEESIKFYRGRADDEFDTFAKDFYNELVKMEQEHHTILVKIEKELLDKLWAHNKYSPF